MAISPVTEARRLNLPLIFGALSPVMPFSTIKPRITSSSVFAQTTKTSAIGELVIHILAPLSTPAAGATFARVVIPAGSEPRSGSVRPKQPTHSPEASFGKYFCRCASVPNAMDRMHHQTGLHAHRRAVAAVHPLDLARDQSVGDVVDPGATVAFDRRAEESERAHLVHDLAVEMLVPVCGEDPREQLFLAIGVCAVAHHPLFLCQRFVQEKRVGPVELALGLSSGRWGNLGGAGHRGLSDWVFQARAV